MPSTSDVDQDQQDPWEVTPGEIDVLQRRFENLVIVDCRTRPEFATGHLPGACSLPLQELSHRAAELDPARERVIVVYCRTGRRSRIMCRFLAHRGFTCVRSMAGGVEACPGRLVGAC